MILTRRVSLGGVLLDELHPAIVIRSVDPGVPKETVSAVDRMGGYGQRVTGQHWQTLEASVTFAIDVGKRQMALRREIFEMVTAWANRKGYLTISWMKGRRMYVDKTVIPGSGDMWNWTDEYTIVFRAYNQPYWENTSATSAVSKTATHATLTVPVLGNAPSVLDVSFRNMSGMSVNSFWVETGGNRITLSSLGLGGSATLTISHGTSGLLAIKAGSTNVYSKYTGADDLYVNPDAATVTFQASRAGILTVTNRGRWV